MEDEEVLKVLCPPEIADQMAAVVQRGRLAGLPELHSLIQVAFDVAVPAGHQPDERDH